MAGRVLARIAPTQPWGVTDDRDWILDLRAIDRVKSSMLDRIARAHSLSDQIKISKYCEEVSQAFIFLGSKALQQPVTDDPVDPRRI